MFFKIIKLVLPICLLVYANLFGEKKVALMGVLLQKASQTVSTEDWERELPFEAHIGYHSEYEAIFKEFQKFFFEKYVPKLPFNLLPEDQVINSPSYKSFFDQFSTIANPDVVITRNGYIPYHSSKIRRSNRAMDSIFIEQNDAVLFVYLDFWWSYVTVIGAGSIKLIAELEIILLDNEGKTIFRIDQSEESKKGFGVVANVPVLNAKSEDKFAPMLTSSFEALLKAMNKKLPKQIKAMSKKMAKHDKKKKKK